MWLSIAVYCAVALAFQGFVFGSRASPPEPDDAYTYIVKSTQIAEGCALQDCPALNSLREQLQTKATTEDAEWQRYRFGGRVFLVYHPLYSTLLLGLNQSGLSWESGFMALSLLGALLIGAGAAFFLLALCGTASTALALVILAFSAFPGQGLTYIVPSNIALGLAFFAFGFALRGWRWWLVATILLMLLMHPVGKVYSCAALLIAVLVNRDFRPVSGVWWPYAVAVLLIGASAFVPLLVEQPLLRAEPEPVPAGFTLLSGLSANLSKAAHVVASGYGRDAALGIPLAFIIYGLAWRGWRQAAEPFRSRIAITGLVLGGMCGALLLHILPRYPAEAFLRGWIALATVIAAAAALAMAGPGGVLALPSFPSTRGWRNLALWCGAFLAVFVISGAAVLVKQAVKIRDRHYQSFEPDQVRLLTERCGTAVHASETSALFYLSHGANRCPSLYLPALGGESGAAIRFADLPAPLMLVAAKPGPGEIAIAHRQPAEIAIREAGARKLQLLFPSDQPLPALQIRVMSPGGEQRLDITPAETGGAVTVDLPPGDAEKIVTIGVTSRFARLTLEGMRLEGETQDWPWNRNVTLSSKRRVYYFSAPDLTAGRFSSMEIIDSRGSTLLAKLTAREPTGAGRP